MNGSHARIKWSLRPSCPSQVVAPITLYGLYRRRKRHDQVCPVISGRKASTGSTQDIPPHVMSSGVQNRTTLPSRRRKLHVHACIKLSSSCTRTSALRRKLYLAVMAIVHVWQSSRTGDTATGFIPGFMNPALTQTTYFNIGTTFCSNPD